MSNPADPSWDLAAALRWLRERSGAVSFNSQGVYVVAGAHSTRTYRDVPLEQAVLEVKQQVERKPS